MAGLFHSLKVTQNPFPIKEGNAKNRVPPFDNLRWPSNAFLRSLPFSSVVKLGVSAWRFVWEETTGPYDIYLNGEFLQQVVTGNYEADILSYTTFPPPIEVIDANGNVDLIDSHLFPPFAQIQWYGDPSATIYFVEEKVGALFVRRQIVNENNQGYHIFRTATLARGIAEWKVIPVDAFGNEGTAIDFVFNIVPPPLPPEAVPVVYNESTLSIVVGP